MSGFNDFAIARALHVLAVLIWIGGVAFVTLVLLPACRALSEPAGQLDLGIVAYVRDAVVGAVQRDLLGDQKRGEALADRAMSCVNIRNSI